MKLSPKSSNGERPRADAGGPDFPALAARIKQWGKELGFQRVGITGTDLADDE